jgi:cytochrome P450
MLGPCYSQIIHSTFRAVLCCVLQALSWTFYLLLQHPEVEQKLLDEIRAVLGTPTGSNDNNDKDADSSSGGVLRPCYDQLRRLRYARAVFMEALRLYPSVPEVGDSCYAALLPVGTTW